MTAPSPERIASFTRTLIEEAAVLVALSLFVATVLLWAEIIGSKIQ